MQLDKALGKAVGLGVDDEVDLALAVQQHVLVAVARHRPEAHALEHLAHGLRVGRGEFDEFKPVRAHGVLPGGGVLRGLLRQCCVHVVSGQKNRNAVHCRRVLSHVSGDLEMQ